MSTKIGQWKSVDPRELWEREDMHFTPWLAQEDSLRLLSEAIGIDLELVEIEKDVGTFKLDMLCKDDSGAFVVFENQLEESNHKHLGQLLTYAAGIKATKNVVWVAISFRDEHIAALDWLNQRANPDARFFAVQIEAWKIDDSLPAPKFNVLSKLNKFTEEVEQVVREGGLSETGLLRIKYWKALIEYLKSPGVDAAFQCGQVKPSSPYLMVKSPLLRGLGLYCGFELPTRGYDDYIVVYLNFGTGEKGAALRKAWWDGERLEQELGKNIEWDENKSWVAVYRDDDPSDEKGWHNQHEWMKNTMDKLIRSASKAVDVGSHDEPTGRPAPKK
jgi:Domain of unknown function (DUF4268)